MRDKDKTVTAQAGHTGLPPLMDLLKQAKKVRGEEIYGTVISTQGIDPATVELVNGISSDAEDGQGYIVSTRVFLPYESPDDVGAKLVRVPGAGVAAPATTLTCNPSDGPPPATPAQ
jgi:hypothetical protein